MYDPVEPDVSFPQLEEEVLEWWRRAGIAERALTFREGAPEFVFSEGPPYANAPPGVHSVLPRVIKDVYTRFQTMKGRFVPRKAGWDCHGLPAEVEVEKKLGFTHKREIVDYGIDRFNHQCRTAVSEYITNYVKFSERIAFWLDYDDAYQTMSNDYIESVWWSLAELHAKDLLFESDRVAAYCPRCETPLSDHELGQEDVYREVTDPGVTLALDLVDPPEALSGAALAVWTTTPWTLLANLAVAVHPDITYAVVEHDGRRLVLAEALIEPALGPFADGPAPVPVSRLTGRELEGLRYRPPFAFAGQWFEANPDTRDAADRAWRVLLADFVNVDEGTGIVHMAGAFGADDLDAVRTAGIPIFNPVDQSGNFDRTVPIYTGTFVKDADPDIIARIAESGALIRSEPYVHSYPHCWRCKSPLLYYALTSWYIRTTARKEQLLAQNEQVNWVPEHIKHGRYGNWLENNVDWSLSRFRFWGTPLPIWRCANRHDVAIGSVSQLEELAGRDLSQLDLHRPHVDEIVFPCATCGDEMRRIPDVIDVWYDAGAMPFAQYGYPRTNVELFERRFPADFIAEGLDQTRGWFYSLMAESVLLFDQNAYKTVICHGLLLDAEGRKMSKSLGNIVDPEHVFGTFGSDALRFYFLSAGNPGDNRRISDQALQQVVRGPFLTLWNVYRLFVLYANIDGFDPAEWSDIGPMYRPAIDRWILSELHQTISEVDEALSVYDSLAAARRITLFIDDLSNWYVRRSRRRFWREAATDEEQADKAAAYWTLWTSLVTVSQLLAPFAPLLADALYRNLVADRNENAVASVHLTDFPEVEPHVVDIELASGMAAARELVSLGRQARTTGGVKVRQPLQRAVLLVPDDLRDAVELVADLVADELNVDEVAFAEEGEALVRVTLRPDYRAAGPVLGPRVRALAAALAAFDDTSAQRAAELLEAGDDLEVDLDGEATQIGPELVEVRREPAEGTAFAYETPFGVSIDLTVTDDLRREGIAREFVHLVQGLRRETGLEVTDRIRLRVSGPDEVAAALREHEDTVREEVLATELALDGVASDARTLQVEGHDVRVDLEKA